MALRPLPFKQMAKNDCIRSTLQYRDFEVIDGSLIELEL